MEQREPALHTWIIDLLSGSFTQNENGPSSVTLQNGTTLYRARLYGIVVSKDELVIDDSTGNIIVRGFDQHFTATLGEPVLVIGRPRMYNEHLYLLGEIVKKVDIRWLQWREKQYPRTQTNPREYALDIVRTLDTGTGADYNNVIARLGTTGEELIVHLLATGELFETKPGKLKILE